MKNIFMKKITKYRLANIAERTVGSGLTSGIISIIFFKIDPDSFYTGLLIGSIGSFLIISYNIFISGIYLSRLSTLKVILINTTVHACVIIGTSHAVFILMNSYLLYKPLELFRFTIIFGISLSFLTSAEMAITGIIGKRILVRLIAGKYLRPKVEDRTFLFSDIIGSTSIAEKLGDKKYIEFINDFFADLTDAVITTGAEIYKYVGDEIIVTWENGLKENQALIFHETAYETIESRKNFYIGKYNVLPEFRTSAHSGPVVVGELGVIKKEITYLGDTLNTGARLLEESKKHGYRMIISGSVESKLSESCRKKIISIGNVSIRGKEIQLDIFGINKC